MPPKFITILDAAKISKKSIQTIRRALKSKKLVYKKKRTPQGFNYLINRDSLCEFFKVHSPVHEAPQETSEKFHSAPKKTHSENGNDKIFISSEDFSNFTVTLEKLISQHSEERQNYLRLINTLQEKIFFLENQVNLLKGPEKRWFHFWK